MSALSVDEIIAELIEQCDKIEVCPMCGDENVVDKDALFCKQCRDHSDVEIQYAFAGHYYTYDELTKHLRESVS